MAHLVPAESIQVLPPLDEEEAGFDELQDWQSIIARVAEIARDKCDDVCGQLAAAGTLFDVVIAADTVIVGEGDGSELFVLGQPPEQEDWREVVAEWFRDFYFGREHTALTALCVAESSDGRIERIVATQVGMVDVDDDLLDWYLHTEEPRGKAGGYAIQGAGSMFVKSVTGSLSNVIGLPLEELRELLRDLKL